MASFDYHKWTSYQLQGARKLVIEDSFTKVEFLAGVAIITDEEKEKAYCSAVVIKRSDLEIVEKTSLETELKEPYIPTFRAVRDAPLIEQCIKQLETEPEILFCHGHGLAHPRFFGLASHIGLSLKIPTIGIANNLLVGEETPSSPQIMSLFHESRLVGYRHIDYEHPNRNLFISPGHLISHESAYSLTIQTLNGEHNLPLALHLAKKEARKLFQNSA
ncbi:MAG: endonuclease V [Candidatus Kariarchaeaceae archaeon]